MQANQLNDLGLHCASIPVTHASIHDFYDDKDDEDEIVANKYRLCQPIGEGAMGSIWRAIDIDTGTRVALKLLHCDLPVYSLQRKYLSDRLEREAAALTRIRHPAVVRVLDFGCTSLNDPFLAMELLEGEPLGTMLDRVGRLSPEYAVQIVLPLADGLGAMHEQGVVHRDLKPDNLFMAFEGHLQPKVIDFGLAKITVGQAGRKLTGVGLLGTPDYMAPEQALELPEVDHRADLWALCVVLYEALSGELPFGGATLIDRLHAIATSEPTPLTHYGVDPALSAIVERGLCKKPEQRWQTMHALGKALASWLVGRGVLVDVTGARLCMQWPVRDVWLRPAQHSDARIQRKEHPRRERASRASKSHRTRRRGSWYRASWRLALSGAAAALVTTAPQPECLMSQAHATITRFTQTQAAHRLTDAPNESRARGLVDNHADEPPRSPPIRRTEPMHGQRSY
jgi:serine/threonine protein kinase